MVPSNHVGIDSDAYMVASQVEKNLERKFDEVLNDLKVNSSNKFKN